MTDGDHGRWLKGVRHRWDDTLARMDPLEFERLMADYYRGQGFRVEHVGTGGAGRKYDGGIDLKLFRDEQYIVVQCKRHTARQIPHNDVHQLLGIMHTERATGAIFINSGEYTPAALRKMEDIPNFQMIDGHELRAMLGPLLGSLPVNHLSVPDFVLGQPSKHSAPDPEKSELVFRSSGRSPTHPQTASGWWLLALICMLSLVMLVKSLLERTAWSAGPTPEQTQSTYRNPLPQPSGEAPDVMQAPVSRQQSELIDWHTGTTIQDRPSNFPQSRRQTAAEIRESQRKADEAMKTIEATTPQM